MIRVSNSRRNLRPPRRTQFRLSMIDMNQTLTTFDDLYKEAKSILNPRRLSEYAEAGGVGAAILSESGRVYLGVCIDTLQLPR
jgi:hypothetical protein